jgi:hypothetical protein
VYVLIKQYKERGYQSLLVLVYEILTLCDDDAYNKMVLMLIGWVNFSLSPKSELRTAFQQLSEAMDLSSFPFSIV